MSKGSKEAKAKTKVADLAKFSFNNSKEQYKAAFASYVQFLITSGEWYRKRDNLVKWLGDVDKEILELIEFE